MHKDGVTLTFLKVQPNGGEKDHACMLLPDCAGGQQTHEIVTGTVEYPDHSTKNSVATLRRGCLTCCKRFGIDALRALE